MKKTVYFLTTFCLGLVFVGLTWAAPVDVPPDEVSHGHQLAEDWRIDEAHAFTEALLEKYPESGDVHFLKARIEFLKGNYEYARKILDRVGNSHAQVREFKTLVRDTHTAAKSFISRESEHFIFRFEQGPDEILVHYAEEVLEKSYQVLGDLLSYRPGQKVLVEFYPDREPFSRISPLTFKDIVTSGTVALCKYNRIMMISPGSLVRGYNWMDTLSHEYIHYLLTKKSRNNLPLWMHEGIAKFYEARWRSAGDYLTPVMETILATGLKNDYLIPLDSMMPSLAKLKTAEDVQLAYAEVSTMIEYLTKIQGDAVIPSLLNNLARGDSFESALSKNIGMDLDAFQEKWKRFAKQKELKTVPGLKPPGVRFKSDRSVESGDKDYREVGLRKAQDLTFLGDILKSRNFHRAALIEYRHAIDQSKTFSPILHNKLAKTHLFIQEFDQAETILKKSLNHYPMFHTTLASLGELYFATGNLKKSRDFYQRAVQVNPFNPFAHLRLMTIYQTLGQKKERELQAKLFEYID
ncbi:hypothetical protein UR09_05150 [Candidatus Nitromaritima sp. SCGC AAA799-A02]|nr:hypothetical protein UR09_05150 [Candidatus Nitromaritima sp. SCGC AAA799-A02]KMP11162.1 hypothetical protein UZ36_05350 [Candidatus Nitromaritima sp. SCGC AAA799-C22]